MTTTAEMFFVYGDLSRASVRFASRFNIIQERIHRCDDANPCKLHACPRCLRASVGRVRVVREWLRTVKGFELSKITLMVPVLIPAADLDSTIERLLAALMKLIRRKNPWSELQSCVAGIHVEVIPPHDGMKYYRFRLQVRLLVAGSAEHAQLAMRWKKLLGAGGFPRRARLRDLVEITGVTTTRTRKRCPQWLLPSSTTVLDAMPSKPSAASSYIEILPKLFKVMFALSV